MAKCGSERYGVNLDVARELDECDAQFREILRDSSNAREAQVAIRTIQKNWKLLFQSPYLAGLRSALK